MGQREVFRTKSLRSEPPYPCRAWSCNPARWRRVKQAQPKPPPEMAWHARSMINRIIVHSEPRPCSSPYQAEDRPWQRHIIRLNQRSSLGSLKGYLQRAGSPCFAVEHECMMSNSFAVEVGSHTRKNSLLEAKCTTDLSSVSLPAGSSAAWDPLCDFTRRRHLSRQLWSLSSTVSP